MIPLRNVFEPEALEVTPTAAAAIELEDLKRKKKILI
jgi:hypothetical protein